jgi:polyhydroxyalkanoate synthesis regulator protein
VCNDERAPVLPLLYARSKAWEKAMSEPQPILVKRYGKSRLYDTSGARYVTLEDLREWTKRGIAFEVRDADTGDDVTRVLLA